MVKQRKEKVDLIANFIPELEIHGDKDAEVVIVGWGGTYGHLLEAVTKIRKNGKKLAFVHFQWINPLPKNSEKILKSYKKIVVAELNTGQFAGYLQMKFQNLPTMKQINRVQGQPFIVDELVDEFTKILEEK